MTISMYYNRVVWFLSGNSACYHWMSTETEDSIGPFRSIAEAKAWARRNKGHITS